MKGKAACWVLKQCELVHCCCFSGLDVGYWPFFSLLFPFRELCGLGSGENSYSDNTHVARPNEESRSFHPKGSTEGLWDP